MTTNEKLMEDAKEWFNNMDIGSKHQMILTL